MITRYNDVLDDNGISCTLFFVKTKKGEAHGIFYPEQTTIYVHGECTPEQKCKVSAFFAARIVIDKVENI